MRPGAARQHDDTRRTRSSEAVGCGCRWLRPNQLRELSHQSGMHGKPASLARAFSVAASTNAVMPSSGGNCDSMRLVMSASSAITIKRVSPAGLIHARTTADKAMARNQQRRSRQRAPATAEAPPAADRQQGGAVVSCARLELHLPAVLLLRGEEPRSAPRPLQPVRARRAVRLREEAVQVPRGVLAEDEAPALQVGAELCPRRRGEGRGGVISANDEPNATEEEQGGSSFTRGR